MDTRIFAGFIKEKVKKNIRLLKLLRLGIEPPEEQSEVLHYCKNFFEPVHRHKLVTKDAILNSPEEIDCLFDKDGKLIAAILVGSKATIPARFRDDLLKLLKSNSLPTTPQAIPYLDNEFIKALLKIDENVEKFSRDFFSNEHIYIQDLEKQFKKKQKKPRLSFLDKIDFFKSFGNV